MVDYRTIRRQVIEAKVNENIGVNSNRAEKYLNLLTKYDYYGERVFDVTIFTALNFDMRINASKRDALKEKNFRTITLGLPA